MLVEYPYLILAQFVVLIKKSVNLIQFKALMLHSWIALNSGVDLDSALKIIFIRINTIK